MDYERFSDKRVRRPQQRINHINAEIPKRGSDVAGDMLIRTRDAPSMRISPDVQLEEILRHNLRRIEREAQSMRDIETDDLLSDFRPYSLRRGGSPGPLTAQRLDANTCHLLSESRCMEPARSFREPAKDSAEVSTIIDNQELCPETKMRNRLLDLLWPQPIDLIHNYLSKSRVDGSGQWVLMHPKYMNWFNITIELHNDPEGVENCLWLQGELGAGKSMLMNAVVSKLKSEIATKPGHDYIAIYYYCDRNNGCKPYQIVSSLLRQMCEPKHITLPPFLLEMQASGSNIDRSTSGRQFQDGTWIANLMSDFLSALSMYKGIYICLDGLEECDDLLELMAVLTRISKVHNTWLVATGRSRIVEQSIALGVGNRDGVVHLEDHNTLDIRKYFEGFIQKSYLSDIITMEARPSLLDKLVEKSGGNFLSAVAQSAQLNRLTSLTEVSDQIEKAPAEQSEVVKQILSSLDDQSPQRSHLAKKVLYWLAVARRALSLKEIQQAVAAEIGATIDNPYRLPPPSLIKAVCMGFVEIDVAKNRVFAVPSALPFYLYQFCNSFAVKSMEYAAMSCLAVLRSSNLSNGPFSSQGDYDNITQKLPFASYVSQNWGVHLSEARDEESMNKILENDSLLEALSQLLHVTSQSTFSSACPYNNYPEGFGSRHFAAYFGLSIAFSKWPTYEDWLVARDSWGRSPLHVWLGSPELYERHVLFDLFTPERFSSLILENVLPKPYWELEFEDLQHNNQEARFRHEPIRGLPWKWGLNYDPDYDYLLAGLRVDNLKKLLTLSRDEAIVVDKDGMMPLHHFMTNWSEDALISLIQIIFDLDDDSDSGSNIDAASESRKTSRLNKYFLMRPDTSDRTILEYACKRGVLVGTLVCEVNRWSLKQMCNGIVIAASHGYTSLVKNMCRMIDRQGSDLELGQAVIEASKRGFTDIVRILRQMGTALSVQDGGGMSALHHAAFGSHPDTVRFLLLEGENPNQVDNSGRSPLFCGCEGGNNAVITLLRENGAIVALQNIDGPTLLHLAARRGSVDVARRLIHLDGGAIVQKALDADAAGLEQQSPLHIAARQAQNFVSIFVDAGFPINASDEDGRTPLSYACEIGHLQSILVLLSGNRRIDINRTDKNKRSPLSYAAAEDHVDVVVALANYGGLDPNIKDVEGKTALIHAAQRGQTDTAMALIILAGNDHESQPPATIKSFEDLRSRLSSKLTENSAVKMDLKDNQGQSALVYLCRHGLQGNQLASQLARYMLEIRQKQKFRWLIANGKGSTVRRDGDGNELTEDLDHQMVDDDHRTRKRSPDGATLRLIVQTIAMGSSYDVVFPVGKVHGMRDGMEFTACKSMTGLALRIFKTDDLESRAKIANEDLALLRAANNTVMLSKLSLDSNSFDIYLDSKFTPELKHYLQEELEYRIAKRVNINITEQEATLQLPFNVWALHKGEDEEVKILGNERLIGYQDPVRGLCITASDTRDLARQSAIALMHLTRFGQAYELSKDASTAPKPFQVHFKATNHSKSTDSYPEGETFRLDFRNTSADDLYFAVIIFGPGFAVRQLFPILNEYRLVPPYSVVKYHFRTRIPKELKDRYEAGKHKYRDILRVIVSKGKPISWRSQSMPEIWSSYDYESDLAHTVAEENQKDSYEFEEIVDFNWWIEDEEIFTHF